MICYEMVTGEWPWRRDIELLDLVGRVRRGDRPIFPDRVDPRWKELITKCWNQSPKKRPTASEIADFICHASMDDLQHQGGQHSDIEDSTRRVQQPASVSPPPPPPLPLLPPTPRKRRAACRPSPGRPDSCPAAGRAVVQEPLFAHWKQDVLDVTKMSVLQGCTIGSVGVLLGSASEAALVTVPLIIAAPSVVFLGIGFAMYGVGKLGQLVYRTL
jgi:hypothetical protein